MRTLMSARSRRRARRLPGSRLREVRLAVCAGSAGGLLVGGATTAAAAVLAAASVLFFTGLWRSSCML